MHYFSNEQLEILKKFKETQQSVTGYLDVTGIPTLVKKVDTVARKFCIILQ